MKAIKTVLIAFILVGGVFAIFTLVVENRPDVPSSVAQPLIPPHVDAPSDTSHATPVSIWRSEVRKDPMTDVPTLTAIQQQATPTVDAAGQPQTATYELRFTCDSSRATLSVRTFVTLLGASSTNAMPREIPGRFLAPDATVPVTSS